MSSIQQKCYVRRSASVYHFIIIYFRLHIINLEKWSCHSSSHILGLSNDILQVFRLFLSFEIQSKFYNMYCFLIACHSRTDWFLCTDMTKKITFKMDSSLEQSIFICSTVPLAVCDHAVFHLFLAHHFIVCCNVFSYDTFFLCFEIANRCRLASFHLSHHSTQLGLIISEVE